MPGFSYRHFVVISESWNDGNPTGEPGQALALMRGISLSKLENQQAGVYFAGQDFAAEPPAFFVERPVARCWLDEGKAWSIHHGRDIALVPELEQQMTEEAGSGNQAVTMAPEESCLMGEHVMDANAEERLWARRLVRSWNWRVAVREYLRSLEKRRQDRERVARHGGPSAEDRL